MTKIQWIAQKVADHPGLHFSSENSVGLVYDGLEAIYI